MCKLVFLNGHLDDIRARPAKKYESRLLSIYTPRYTRFYHFALLFFINNGKNILPNPLYFWQTKIIRIHAKTYCIISIKNCVTLVKEKNQSNFYITPSQHLRRKCKQKFLQKCMLKQNYLLKLKAKNYNKSTPLLQ